jgi:hypothetical protein
MGAESSTLAMEKTLVSVRSRSSFPRRCPPFAALHRARSEASALRFAAARATAARAAALPAPRR